MKSFALWDVEKLGYLAAYAGAALASGQITGAEGQTFKAGTLGEFKIGAQRHRAARRAHRLHGGQRGQVQLLGAPLRRWCRDQRRSLAEHDCRIVLSK